MNRLSRRGCLQQNRCSKPFWKFLSNNYSKIKKEGFGYKEQTNARRGVCGNTPQEEVKAVTK